MRAARAAAARGDEFTLGGPSEQYYAERKARGSSQYHSGGSRPRVRMLPPGRNATASRRHTTPNPQQKRVPKGSAGKRSRVVAAAMRGQAFRHRDVDSRFPMPYPGGVDRKADAQLQNHQRYFDHPGQSEPTRRAGCGHPGSRRTTASEDHSHGQVGRRRRTRPRSAVVVPLSRTGSGHVNGQGQPPVGKSKRKQEVSKAVTSAEERGRGGSSKRLRCAGTGKLHFNTTRY